MQREDLKKYMEKMEKRVASNPDFKKISQYYIITVLNKINPSEEMLNNIEEIKMIKNNKKEYQSKGWYSSDLLKHSPSPEELYNSIDCELKKINEVHKLLIDWSRDEENNLHFWEAPGYLLFQPKVLQKNIKEKYYE